MRLTCALLLFVTCGAALAQPLEPLGLTSAETIAAIGNADDAADLVKRTIADLGTGRPPRPTTVVFANEIPANWLPVLPNHRFEILPESDVAKYVAGCGKHLFVHGAVRGRHGVAISVGYGNACSYSGTEKTFLRGPDGWENVPIAGGFVSGMPHCACR